MECFTIMTIRHGGNYPDITNMMKIALCTKGAIGQVIKFLPMTNMKILKLVWSDQIVGYAKKNRSDPSQHDISAIYRVLISHTSTRNYDVHKTGAKQRVETGA